MLKEKPKQDSRFPKQREFVIGIIKRINPFSAYVDLEEYPGKEGMLHIGEVAPRRIKDIRNFIKIGQKAVFLVMKIDPEKGFITLSLKRVSKFDSQNKMQKYKREIKSKKIYNIIEKELKLTPEEVQKIKEKLQESYEDSLKAFQLILIGGKEILTEAGIDEKQAKELEEIIKDLIKLKEKIIKKTINIQSFDSNGIDKIKSALEKAQKKYNVKISYISAPLYSIKIKTKNPKEGERILKQAIEEIKNQVK